MGDVLLRSYYTRHMRLNYHTGIATLVQLFVMTLLILVNGVESVASSCTSDSGNCTDAIFVSVVFFIVTGLWFGGIWVLGFAAQDRRSRKLAYLLIVTELAVILVASFNARNYPNALSLVTSLVDIALAAWVIILAFKLSRAGGGRIMPGKRGRQHRSHRAANRLD